MTSVFFPGECRLCRRLLSDASLIPICGDCLAAFSVLRGRLCHVCGQPVDVVSFNPPDTRESSTASPEVCRSCEITAYAFERARSYALYQGDLVRAIVMLKFEAILPLANWFARRLAEVAQKARLTDADVVVSVPLHPNRQRERGYNQAELLAKPLAKLLKLQHQRALLVRTRPRPDKHILSLRERWESVRGAFATVPGAKVDNLRVLLVDDVLTTGATLDACAKALRKAGAKSVLGLTIARAARHPVVGSVQI